MYEGYQGNTLAECKQRARDKKKGYFSFYRSGNTTQCKIPKEGSTPSFNETLGNDSKLYKQNKAITCHIIDDTTARPWANQENYPLNDAQNDGFHGVHHVERLYHTSVSPQVHLR